MVLYLGVSLFQGALSKEWGEPKENQTSANSHFETHSSRDMLGCQRIFGSAESASFEVGPQSLAHSFPTAGTVAQREIKDDPFAEHWPKSGNQKVTGW